MQASISANYTPIALPTGDIFKAAIPSISLPAKKKAKVATSPDFLQAILSGDAQSLRELYEECLPAVLTFVRKNSGSEEDARDIFQDGILLIFNKAREEMLPQNLSVQGYLYGVCKNLWFNKMKRKNRTERSLEGNTEQHAMDLDIEEFLVQKERKEIFRDAFQLLKEDQQTLLKLAFSGKTNAEIAGIMGYSSESYAKKKRFYCKKDLISRIQADPRYQELQEFVQA